MLKLAGEFIEGQLADHIATLDAHTKNIYEVLKTGEYYTNSFGYNKNLVISANTLYGIFFFLARDVTVDRIACEVTAQAGQKIRMGIYGVTGNVLIGALEDDSGEITLSGTGVQAITIDPAISLSKGVHFLGIVSDGTPTIKSATTYRGDIPVLGVKGTIFSNCAYGYSIAHTYGPLPNPFGAGQALYYNEHLMILPRIASLA